MAEFTQTILLVDSLLTLILVCSLGHLTIQSFRFVYEYKIEFQCDFSNLSLHALDNHLSDQWCF